MSHLIEEYAKNLGVKIAKPIVSKHFWPVIPEKYLTIYLEPHLSSKKYKYYDIVIDSIRPFLDKNDIKVIQIGESSAGRLQNADEIIFDLDFKKCAYIISQSSVHVGVDSKFSHYANSIGVPTVTLFGNIYAPVSRGYWNPQISIDIEAPWKVKPCMGPVDPEDTINKIVPEKIAQSILDQLGCKTQLPLTTHFIGDFYHNKVYELIPNFFEPSPEMANAHWFLRLDHMESGEYVEMWCSFLKSFSFFTKKIIPPDFIHRFKDKLKSINFIIDEDTAISDSYFNFLKGCGVSATLLVEKEEDLPKLRDKFFEQEVQLYSPGGKSQLGEIKIDFNKCSFSSSKTLVSKGKKYPSFFHWKMGQNLVDKNFKIEDNEDLLKEINHFYIYDTNKKF
jgi:hypothetical protein